MKKQRISIIVSNCVLHIALEIAALAWSFALLVVFFASANESMGHFASTESDDGFKELSERFPKWK